MNFELIGALYFYIWGRFQRGADFIAEGVISRIGTYCSRHLRELNYRLPSRLYQEWRPRLKRHRSSGLYDPDDSLYRFYRGTSSHPRGCFRKFPSGFWLHSPCLCRHCRHGQFRDASQRRQDSASPIPDVSHSFRTSAWSRYPPVRQRT